jgi:hypothetical protein
MQYNYILKKQWLESESVWVQLNWLKQIKIQKEYLKPVVDVCISDILNHCTNLEKLQNFICFLRLVKNGSIYFDENFITLVLNEIQCEIADSYELIVDADGSSCKNSTYKTDIFTALFYFVKGTQKTDQTSWIDCIFVAESIKYYYEYLDSMEYCGKWCGYSSIIKEKISWETIFITQIINNIINCNKNIIIYDKIVSLNKRELNYFMIYVETIMSDLNNLKNHVSFLINDWFENQIV